jgi:hypothetical protein
LKILGYKRDISGIKKFYDYVGNFYVVHNGDSDGAENTIETNILFKIYRRLDQLS